MKNCIVGMLCLCLSCGTPVKKETPTAQATLPTPKSTIDNGLKVPVYDYQALAPLLDRSDGKTYVVNFWATWCKPCIEELPHFERIRSEFSPDELEVVLVSLDMQRHWESQLVPFVKERKLQSSVVILDDPDQNDWIPKVDESWSGAIPATLIYKDGRRSFHEKQFSYTSLRQEIEPLLNSNNNELE